MTTDKFGCDQMNISCPKHIINMTNLIHIPLEVPAIFKGLITNNPPGPLKVMLNGDGSQCN